MFLGGSGGIPTTTYLSQHGSLSSSTVWPTSSQHSQSGLEVSVVLTNYPIIKNRSLYVDISVIHTTDHFQSGQ